jgi:hypothetical protein
MGNQIIKQPDGLYAVFSSTTDTWVLYDWGREALIDFLAREWGGDIRRKVDQVDTDPRRAYPIFGLTFAEANQMSIKHGGEDLSGKLADTRTLPARNDR